MTPTTSQRDRLSDVRNRARELRERRTLAREHQLAAREAAANYSGENIEHSEEFCGCSAPPVTSRRSATRSSWWTPRNASCCPSWPASTAPATRSAGVAASCTTRARSRSCASSRSSDPIGNVSLGQLVSRDEWVPRHGQAAAQVWRVGNEWGTARFAVSELDTPSTADSRSRSYGVTPQLRRPLTLLDVIPAEPMDQGSFDYEREGGTIASAAENAEGAVAAAADASGRRLHGTRPSRALERIESRRELAGRTEALRRGLLRHHRSRVRRQQRLVTFVGGITGGLTVLSALVRRSPSSRPPKTAPAKWQEPLDTPCWATPTLSARRPALKIFAQVTPPGPYSPAR